MPGYKAVFGKELVDRVEASMTDDSCNMGQSGIRLDEGKPRWDLIPPDAMLEVVKVFTGGAKKYEDRNWEKGMKWNRHFAAMQRHLWKWQAGNSLDEESGLNHLAHAAFGCLALLAYELRQIGEDDRPKLGGDNAKNV